MFSCTSSLALYSYRTAIGLQTTIFSRFNDSSLARLYSTLSPEKAHIQKQVLKLRKSLKKYSKSYYVNSVSLISDEEYDKLFHQLDTLEQENPWLSTIDSPTQLVGSSLASNSQTESTYPHSVPMMSLANAFNMEDMRRWDERCRKFLADAQIDLSQLAYCVEMKYDGIAVSLEYEYGELARVITRGDGKIGEDLNLNWISVLVPSMIFSLPKEYSKHKKTIIRGEIYLKRKEFDRYNRIMENAYTSPRNLCSGILKRKKEKKVANSNNTNFNDVKLSIVAYNLIVLDEEVKQTRKIKADKTQSEILSELERIGFNSGKPWISVISNIDEFEKIEKDWEKRREEFGFDADGMVAKLENRDYHPILGHTSHSPRFAIAWKFPAKRAITKIAAIEMSVGRTGKVTPVAIVDPVKLAGSVITRATLHNRDHVEKFGIGVGSEVVIERSGDVIPKIVSVSDKSPKKSSSIIDWTTCPCELKQPLVKHGNSDVACVHVHCPTQKLRRIDHFCRVLNIKGLGTSTIEALVEYEIVKSIEDLFKLEDHIPKLRIVDGWGDKKIDNLLVGIEASKNSCTFETLLHALGIPNVGKETAVLLAREFRSIHALIQASTKPENLETVYDVGPVAALSVSVFFSQSSSLKLIKSLQDIGFKMETVGQSKRVGAPESPANLQHPQISGKEFVITGVLESMTRKELESAIENRGGSVKAAITKKTNFLVCGEETTGKASTKLRKATELGVLTIDENKILEMLSINHGKPLMS